VTVICSTVPTLKPEGRAERCLDVAGVAVRCGYQNSCQLSTIFHTPFLSQRCHSFLSPIMASSNDPFRTPQSTTPAFESGYLSVSDQFSLFIAAVFPAVFSTFPPLCLRFFRLFPILHFFPPTSFNVRSNPMRIRWLRRISQHLRPLTAQ
jgi:hypothetical protein